MTQINILKTTLLIILSLSSLHAEEVVKENNATIVPAQTVPQEAIAVIVVKEKIQDANDITITMPPIPVVPVATTKVPKLIILDARGNLVEKDSMDSYYKKEEVIFSKNVAPAKFNRSYGQKTEKVLVGDISNGRVAAYLHTDFMSVKEVEEKLKTAGFDILDSFKVDKKGTATSIVFTNAAMQKGASQAQRGFAASMRITVDKKNKLLSISNPIYLMKAFMQEEYDKELAQATLKTLRDTFSTLKNSKELVKFNVLARFQFMENMPYYQDMKVVSEATNEELLKKLRNLSKWCLSSISITEVFFLV
ncbi:MAG: hypothetical protein Q9M43_03035 [Sulfurimonas sp.]|nr:hypothetical protein [Sulfurimonas sp.]